MIAGLVYDHRVSTWVTVANWIARNRETPLPLSERLTTDLRGVNGLADVLVDRVVSEA